ncbi:MAG: hypothetical protein JO021_23005 [Alphaproteobacteria bacterium]|nr:hypothetical protein [Alphaproteobacteria bacterium]
MSWGAVFAGGVTAAAVSMILMALGSGLGFASVSPWSSHNPSVTTFTVAAGVWLIVTHWIASGFAGYMAGRLRTKWVDLHTNEVLFRDTAHGFAAWAVAVLMVVAAGAFATTVGVGAASTVGAGAASNPSIADQTTANTDALFRTTQADANPQAMSQARAEAGRIIAGGIASGDVPAADRTYLAELVAARTGVDQPTAQQRVDQAIAKAKDTADKARKAASASSFSLALALVIGAFIASVAAAYGGRLRDDV